MSHPSISTGVQQLQKTHNRSSSSAHRFDSSAAATKSSGSSARRNIGRAACMGSSCSSRRAAPAVPLAPARTPWWYMTTIGKSFNFQDSLNRQRYTGDFQTWFLPMNTPTEVVLANEQNCKARRDKPVLYSSNNAAADTLKTSTFIGLTPPERALKQAVGQTVPGAFEAGEQDGRRSERKRPPHLEEDISMRGQAFDFQSSPSRAQRASYICSHWLRAHK